MNVCIKRIFVLNIDVLIEGCAMLFCLVECKFLKIHNASPVNVVCTNVVLVQCFVSWDYSPASN